MPPEDPALPLEPPPALLEPELPPPLELLELELLLELEPLAPPELGDEAPELEEGGVGTEGVVGVLAEGQPASISKTPTKPTAKRGRIGAGKKTRVACFIVVAMPCCRCRGASDQKTKQSYQSPQALPLHSAA
jgi:hypothetical protein